MRLRRPDLSFGAKCMYARLLRYSQGGRCNPSLKTLGRELGISRDQARYYVGQLEKAGFLKVTTGLGRTHTSNYSIEPPEKVAKLPLGKGAKLPTQETIVSRRKQSLKKEAEPTNGVSHESDRRPKTNGSYHPTLDDAKAFAQLMFSSTAKAEKPSTALNWLKQAPRAAGFEDIRVFLQDKLARTRPRTNAWFKTVIENQYGLSAGDKDSLLADLRKHYLEAVRLPPDRRRLECIAHGRARLGRQWD